MYFIFKLFLMIHIYLKIIKEGTYEPLMDLLFLNLYLMQIITTLF